MKNKTKLVKIALAVIITVLFIYFGVMPFIFGGKKMKSFCNNITPGMKSSDIIKLAERHHYKVVGTSTRGNHRITIINTGAMGRFICDVSLAHGSVVEAKYVHND